MKKHILTQVEWENDKANKILEFVRNELFLNMPYMSIALNQLTYKPDDQIETIATDGRFLFFSSLKMIDLFKNNQRYIDRAYLHSIMHCLFSHLWIRQDRNQKLWSIACDICVEYTIDHLNKPCTNRILSLLRKETYQKLESETMGISAAQVYHWLLSQENINKLEYEFYTDDHRYWPQEEKSNAPTPNNSVQNSWQKIARQTMLDQKKKGSENEDEGSSLMATQIKVVKNKRNYKEFLRKFSITQEELHPNPDEFDLSYYTYGLSIYKNMPLIEDIETKEVHKIQEFVIIIDTSYSTSGKLVKSFLKETYTILSQTDSFFRKTNIRIIQCDETIQKDDLIQSKEEMERLLNNFTLIGGGNTDFRPAFTYVDELINTGQIKHLSGLLYFTDGKGTYPKRRPNYKSAFLFLDDYDETKVPPWAITLKLDPIEFEKE